MNSRHHREPFRPRPSAERRTNALVFADRKFMRTTVQLKAYLRGSFPSVRDVEDVAQESYLRVWKAYATRPIRSAKALFYTVARRVALNVVRSQRRSPVIFVTDFEGLCLRRCAGCRIRGRGGPGD